MKSTNGVSKSDIHMPSERSQPQAGALTRLLAKTQKEVNISNDVKSESSSRVEKGKAQVSDYSSLGVSDDGCVHKVMPNDGNLVGTNSELKVLIHKIKSVLKAKTQKGLNTIEEAEVCESGTMMNVEDQDTIDVYVNSLNGVSNVKSNFVISNLPKLKDQFVVDIGCMTGKVLDEISQSPLVKRAEGIDINSSYIEEARKTYPKHQFQILDPSKGLPYNDKEVSVFSISAVLHEIYTYNDFSKEPVINTLKEMHRALKPGGKAIIREPAMPPNPNELLRIKLSSEDGENPNTDEELLAFEVPKDLSLQSRMKRFLLQFKPIDLFQNKDVKDQIRQNSDGSYNLHAWLVSEFLRKRECHPKGFWNAEMGEHNGPFECDDIKELAKRAGFQEQKIDISYHFEKPWYGTIKDGEGISITDVNGKSVSQQERLPSHIYAFLEKE